MQPVPEWLGSDKGGCILLGSFGPLLHDSVSFVSLDWPPVMVIQSLAFLVVSALLLWCPSVNRHVNWLISFNVFGEKSSLWSQGHFSHSVLAGSHRSVMLQIYNLGQEDSLGPQSYRLSCPLSGMSGTWHVPWSSTIASQAACLPPHLRPPLLLLSPENLSPMQ